MLKKGYLLRLTFAIGLMGTGTILGWNAMLESDVLFLVSGLFVFGSGTALVAYAEMKRLFQQGMG